MSEREEHERFERRVRHVASCLWPTGGPGNPELHEGRERDAVFVTEDAVHVVEATSSDPLGPKRDPFVLQASN